MLETPKGVKSLVPIFKQLKKKEFQMLRQTRTCSLTRFNLEK